MYTKTLITEIKQLIETFNLNCSVYTFDKNVSFAYISKYGRLSEEFIEKFQDKVHWEYISQFQKLSEQFIERFQDKVDWECISTYQKLSEQFIEKFQNKVDWNYISVNQKLSEEFIEKFKNKVHWSYISKYQKLSEQFIEKFKNKVHWSYISKYQKLSKKFRNKYKLKLNTNSWLYTSTKTKLKYIKANTKYKVIDDSYIIAYKGIRYDNYSKYNFQYKYEVGKTYTAHCDCNLDNENSFGLSAWTLKNARKYSDETVIKVKIFIKDIGAIVHDENKIRCKKFTVIKKL